MSILIDAYHKNKRKMPDRLLLFASGRMAFFILEDALSVARLLGEPLSDPSELGADAVVFDRLRIPEITSRLQHAGCKVSAFRRTEKPPRKWEPFSVESSPDISNIAFSNQVAGDDIISDLESGEADPETVSSWIWYSFPRMAGEWDTSKEKNHGFRTLRESRIFLKRKPIANRTRRMAQALLSLDREKALDMLGLEGALHLRASATLFCLTAKESEDREIFRSILQNFFDSSRDEETIKVIVKELQSPRDDTPRDLVLVDTPDRIASRTAFRSC